jgi:hypothetical protein
LSKTGKEYQVSFLIKGVLEGSRFEDMIVKGVESLGTAASRPMTVITGLPLTQKHKESGEDRTYYDIFRTVEIRPSRRVQGISNQYSLTGAQQIVLGLQQDTPDLGHETTVGDFEREQLRWHEMAGACNDRDPEDLFFEMHCRQFALDPEDDFVNRCHPANIDRYIWEIVRASQASWIPRGLKVIDYPQGMVESRDQQYEQATYFSRDRSMVRFIELQLSQSKQVVASTSALMNPGLQHDPAARAQHFLDLFEYPHDERPSNWEEIDWEDVVERGISRRSFQQAARERGGFDSTLLPVDKKFQKKAKRVFERDRELEANGGKKKPKEPKASSNIKKRRREEGAEETSTPTHPSKKSVPASSQ